MTNTSATGGFLQERNGPLLIEALEDIWHDVLAGITGIGAKLVRPSRQINPTRQPKPGVDWIAFEIVRAYGDPVPYVRHDSADDGKDIVIDHQRYSIRAACYGSHSDDTAGKIKRGLWVWQNRSLLRKAGIALQIVDDPQTVPEIDGETWIQRTDIEAVFVVETTGDYAVLNLLRARGQIASDSGIQTDFDTNKEEING